MRGRTGIDISLLLALLALGFVVGGCRKQRTPSDNQPAGTRKTAPAQPDKMVPNATKPSETDTLRKETAPKGTPPQAAKPPLPLTTGEQEAAPTERSASGNSREPTPKVASVYDPRFYGAVSNGDLAAVKLMLKGRPELAHGGQGMMGRYPLHIAALWNQPERVSLLLEYGVDLNVPEKIGGGTPLHIAAQKGHTEVINVLLDAGANLNAPTDDGSTPLIDAAAYNQPGAASLLLSKGADIAAKDKYGDTARSWATRRRHSEMLEVLDRHGNRTQRATSVPAASQ